MFLDEISIQNSKKLNIIVLDSGKFHKAKKLLIPENYRFIFSCPSVPGYNPKEPSEAYHHYKKLNKKMEKKCWQNSNEFLELLLFEFERNQNVIIRKFLSITNKKDNIIHRFQFINNNVILLPKKYKQLKY